MVLEINVRINENAIVTGLNRKANEIPKYMARFREDILDIAHRWVQREAPRKTGNLKTAIKKKQQGNIGVIFRDKHQADYIDFVIDGTRPHTIRAKHAGALWFGAKGYGNVVTPGGNSHWTGLAHPVKSVRHPGTKSNPFFDRAYPRISADIDRRVQALEKWLMEI